ncbi:hypothetical protein [Deinococcus roseus]|uniref:Uncharacterized protein n=1 Tax=Deinococcus roseus TaxID=392414 RepID=A0ABQ2DDB1_9DEIO|nr:hypothetical protein [Deinococcus roseus]GGJ51975.1 hypothetical protein GCM10008938_42480 [Deinococcus roseus]
MLFLISLLIGLIFGLLIGGAVLLLAHGITGTRILQKAPGPMKVPIKAPGKAPAQPAMKHWIG